MTAFRGTEDPPYEYVPGVTTTTGSYTFSKSYALSTGVCPDCGAFTDISTYAAPSVGMFICASCFIEVHFSLSPDGSVKITNTK